MSEWKCEICNSSFENFDARGFDNKIYCPLCYYKKLYKDTEIERERLNNIINKLEKYINEEYAYDELGMKIFDASKLQDKLQELKGSESDE